MLILLFLLGALQPVPQEKYDNAVDYVGWQVMDAYMKDYTNIRPDRTAEMKGYDIFKHHFSPDSYSIENPPKSDSVKQLLTKNDWSNAYKNLYSRIINWKSLYNNDWNTQEASDYLESQIENISLRSLGVEDSAYANFQITKAQLQDEIAQYFTPAIQKDANSISVDTGHTALVTSQEEQADLSENSLSFFSAIGGTQSWSGYLNIASIVLCLLLLGLLIYLFNMYKKMDERLDRHRKEITEINSELFVLKKKASNAEKETKLSGRLEALESRVERINDEYERPHEATRPEPSYTKEMSAVAAKPRTEEFYLSTPNSDGTFNVSSMSPSYKPTASIYKFMVTEENGESTASFTVADQYESVKDALSSPGSYLDPVCESVNAFSPSAKRIINLKPGRAFKRGEQWIVRPEDKAIIRYE